MDADSCYPFFIPPPFAPFTGSASPERYEDKLEPVPELELHFNTLFMLESEKGRSKFPSEYTTCDYEGVQLQNLIGSYDAESTASMTKQESLSCSELSNFSHCTSDNVQSIDSSPVKSSFTTNSDLTDISNNWFNIPGDNIYTGRITPDSISGDIIESPEKHPLPSLEIAFSKRFGKCSGEDASIPFNGACNNLDLYPHPKTDLTINNFDAYSYPDNLNDAKQSVDKNVQFSDLLSYINTNDKYDMLDLGIRVFDGEHQENDLVADLDSLNCLPEDDEDDLVGFEEYWPTKCESSQDSNDPVICYWKDCNVGCVNQALLVEHIEKIHVNSYRGEEFTCLWDSCSRKRRPFNARYKLVIHMRVHTGHKPNICSFTGCGKAFSRLENLKIHSRSHTGERPYRCQAPRCMKAFSNSSDRAKHQRTHFNARPYACQIDGCTKRYTDPSSLRKHVKVHNNLNEHAVVQNRNEPEPPQNKFKIQNSRRIREVTKPSFDEELRNRKRRSDFNMSDAKRKIKEKIQGNSGNMENSITFSGDNHFFDWDFELSSEFQNQTALDNLDSLSSSLYSLE